MSNRLDTLKHNVERMLTVLRDAGPADWVEVTIDRLKNLHQRLLALAMAPTPRFDDRIEAEFYAIVESHPKVRQASQSVFKQEVVDICAEGLAFFAELAKERELTSRELEELRSVEREYQRATEELERLRCDWRHDERH